MKQHTIVQSSRILLSFLFVFGAISKLISMPFFDGMVAELLLGKDYFDQPSGMLWVQWLTRILVAVELVLGLALLQNKWFKELVLPSTMGMLILFTVHLFYEGFRQENGFTEGNCGCFGDVLPMTNLESIIKNVLGLLAGIFAWVRYRNQNQFSTWVAPAFLGVITLFTLSFGIKNYKPTSAAVFTELDTIKKLADTKSLDDSLSAEFAAEKIEPEEEFTVRQTTPQKTTAPKSTQDQKTALTVETQPKTSSADKVPLDKTLQLLYTYVPDLQSENIASKPTLVCLFSMTCSHCQEVYRDLIAMKGSGKLPQLHLVNYGTAYEQNYFFTQGGNVKSPHTRIDDFTDFKRMLEGKTYPRIIYVKDGKIAKEWDVDTYEKLNFMSYFGIEKLEEKKESGGLQLEIQGEQSPW